MVRAVAETHLQVFNWFAEDDAAIVKALSFALQEVARLSGLQDPLQATVMRAREPSAHVQASGTSELTSTSGPAIKILAWHEQEETADAAVLQYLLHLLQAFTGGKATSHALQYLTDVILKLLEQIGWPSLKGTRLASTCVSDEQHKLLAIESGLPTPFTLSLGLSFFQECSILAWLRSVDMFFKVERSTEIVGKRRKGMQMEIYRVSFEDSVILLPGGLAPHPSIQLRLIQLQRAIHCHTRPTPEPRYIFDRGRQLQLAAVLVRHIEKVHTASCRLEALQFLLTLGSQESKEHDRKSNGAPISEPVEWASLYNLQLDAVRLAALDTNSKVRAAAAEGSGRLVASWCSPGHDASRDIHTSGTDSAYSTNPAQLCRAVELGALVASCMGDHCQKAACAWKASLLALSGVLANVASGLMPHAALRTHPAVILQLPQTEMAAPMSQVGVIVIALLCFATLSWYSLLLCTIPYSTYRCVQEQTLAYSRLCTLQVTIVASNALQLFLEWMTQSSPASHGSAQNVTALVSSAVQLVQQRLADAAGPSDR